MEIFFFLLSVLLLLIFGYAQLQKNTIKMPGRISTPHEEDD
jgi:hypothetical protein